MQIKENPKTGEVTITYSAEEFNAMLAQLVLADDLLREKRQAQPQLQLRLH